MRGESAITLSIWIRSRYRLVIPSSHIHAYWFWSLLLLPRSSGSWDIDSLSSQNPENPDKWWKSERGIGIALSIWQLASVSLLLPSSHSPGHWCWSSSCWSRVVSGSWDIDNSSSRITYQISRREVKMGEIVISQLPEQLRMQVDQSWNPHGLYYRHGYWDRGERAYGRSNMTVSLIGNLFCRPHAL